ncbi:MAG: nucleotidyl transferase AbiEii/AbiGii toxin family protein [Bacteroidales bacterium]|nr:nucleotidyl transferase AbiEii/AbiGii toxin family protein [Bacteroidales bacterium]
MFHKEILNVKQIELLPLIGEFKREYYLVGGTAIALYLGHRRSIDFDLFKFAQLNRKKNLEKIQSSGFPSIVAWNVTDQMNLVVNEVKITFFQYPFQIKANNDFDNIIRLPELLDLAAMKAYALGRRSKWKDYVDLYFLLKSNFSLDEISQRAVEVYGELFSDKLFRSQLSYFEDIDYSEEVDYIIANPPSDNEIKQYLIEVSTAIV